MLSAGRLAVASACVATVFGCTEVTTDGMVGRLDAGYETVGEDSIWHDAASALEGVWLGGFETEDNTVFFLNHAAPGSLNVVWPVWRGSQLETEPTLAVTSILDGITYLNVNPMYEGSHRDSSHFWPLRYRMERDRMLLWVLDEDYVEAAEEAGWITAVVDSFDSNRRLNVPAEDLKHLLSESLWDAWYKDEIMVLRRVADLPVD